MSTHHSAAPIWAVSDLSVLQPSNLQLTRPLRAWERRPLSPFARRKTGAKKIWKRAETVHHVRMSQQHSQQTSSTPIKTTKRRCVSAAEAIGTFFERLASPNKRIVTRSSGARDLIALPQDFCEDDQKNIPFAEQDAVDIEATVIEVLDEHGRTVEVQHNIDADEWTDEEDVDFNNTMMHLRGAAEHESDSLDTRSGSYGATKDPSLHASNTDHAHHQALQTIHLSGANPQIASTTASAPLPAGFVSPVRRRRTVSKRLQDAGRRHSTPFAFAPEIHLPTAALVYEIDNHDAEEEDQIVPTSDINDLDTDKEHASTVNAVLYEENQSGNLSPRAARNDVRQEQAVTDRVDNTKFAGAEPGETAAVVVNVQQLSTPPQPITTPSLRRSPRRKSSSPVKPRNMAASETRSHIIALSPMKQNASTKDRLAADELAHDSEVNVSSPSSIVIRESPTGPGQQSPRRIVKSRLSDDTAFLQAFLNRAAESKSTSGLDVASKEALLNRRESATIKEAMSSPEKTSVLLDLDPNTVSPSKSAVIRDTRFSKCLPNEENDQDESSSETGPARLRRSGRDRNVNDRVVPTVPTRITLRGNNPVQTFKPTETQELIMLTKKNTRINKGNAITPGLRVLEMDDDLLSVDIARDYETGAGTKVTWNDTPEIFVLEITATQAEAEDESTKRAITSIGAVSKHGSSRLGRNQAKQSSPSSKARPRKTKRLPGTPARLPLATLNDEADPKKAELDGVGAMAAGALLHASNSASAPPAGSNTGILPPAAAKAGSSSTTRTRVPANSAKSSVKAKSRMPSRLPAPKLSFAAALEAVKPVSLSARDEVLNTTLAMASPPKRRASVFDRKLFSSATSSEPEQSQTAPTPSLASPAKKIRRAVVFGTGQLDGHVNDASTRVRETPGLSSPAKKRTR